MLKFVSRISFNSNDWSQKRDPKTGRIVIRENGGVRERTTKIVDFLCHQRKGKTAIAILHVLQDEHASYTLADIQQPLKQLEKAGLLQLQGTGTEKTYSLVKDAKNKWKRASKKSLTVS